MAGASLISTVTAGAELVPAGVPDLELSNQQVLVSISTFKSIQHYNNRCFLIQYKCSIYRKRYAPILFPTFHPCYQRANLIIFPSTQLCLRELKMGKSHLQV